MISRVEGNHQIRVAHGWVAFRLNMPNGGNAGLFATDTFQIDADGNRVDGGYEQMKIVRLDKVDEDWWRSLTGDGVWGGGLFQK